MYRKVVVHLEEIAIEVVSATLPSLLLHKSFARSVACTRERYHEGGVACPRVSPRKSNCTRQLFIHPYAHVGARFPRIQRDLGCIRKVSISEITLLRIDIFSYSQRIRISCSILFSQGHCSIGAEISKSC